MYVTTEEPWEQTAQITWPLAVAIVMSVVAILGTFGNICIVSAVLLHKRLRKSNNVFIINLAVADIIITAYIMPTGIATSQYQLNPFSGVVCDVNAFLITTTCGVSTQSLMLIAMERYILICHYHYHDKIFSKKLIAIYTCVTWVYTGIWACQGWTGWTEFRYGLDTYICTFHGPTSLSYNICLALFGMLLPIVVLIFCYVSIFHTAWKSHITVESKKPTTAALENDNSKKKSLTSKAKQQKQRKERQLVLMLFIIVMVFIVFWTPAAVVLAISSVHNVPLIAYTVTIWMALCNSAVNSIIYGAMNRNFREGYLQFVRHLACCCLDINSKKRIGPGKKNGCGPCGNCGESSHSNTNDSKPNSQESNFSQLSHTSINTQVSAASLAGSGRVNPNSPSPAFNKSPPVEEVEMKICSDASPKYQYSSSVSNGVGTSQVLSVSAVKKKDSADCDASHQNKTGHRSDSQKSVLTCSAVTFDTHL